MASSPQQDFLYALWTFFLLLGLFLLDWANIVVFYISCSIQPPSLNDVDPTHAILRIVRSIPLSIAVEQCLLAVIEESVRFFTVDGIVTDKEIRLRHTKRDAEDVLDEEEDGACLERIPADDEQDSH
jgi:hypothetical protein